jgi:hypothetical protein
LRHSHGRPIAIPIHPAWAEILNAVSVKEREGFVIPFDAKRDLQVGFWIGNNLPVQLEGLLPATPSFRNVYIRAR